MYITKSDTKEKELIAQISIDPNDNKSVIFSWTDFSNAASDIVLSFNGHSDKTKIIFQMNVTIEYNEKKVSFIKDAYKTKNSSVSIEWDNANGSKINYGWSKSIAKPNFL